MAREERHEYIRTCDRCRATGSALSHGAVSPTHAPVPKGWVSVIFSPPETDGLTGMDLCPECVELFWQWARPAK